MSINTSSKPVLARAPQPLRLDRNAKVRVYGATLAATRDKRVLWALQELGIPYELIAFNLLSGEHINPDYMHIHPAALVPTMQVDDFYMIESVGIMMILADRFAEHGLAPPPDHIERPAYTQWMFFGAATLESVVARIMHAVPRGIEPNPEELQAQLKLFDRYVMALEKALEERDYLLDFGFSAADISVGWNLHAADYIGLLPQYPVLKRYYDRLAARPAFQAAFTGEDYYNR